MLLTGKVAFVSGAGRGIGRAIAVALAQAGARVAVNDLANSADAEQTLSDIRAAGGDGLLVPADVSDYSAVEAAVAQTAKHFGRVDIAVTNAVYSDRELFHVAKLDGFRRTIDVTMWGAFHVLRAATNQMLKQGGGGSVVIVGSPHAIVPVPTAMAYNMAKAAIDQMARTAAIELVPHRIRVNILHPGWTDTPGERKFASDEQLREVARNLPPGRLARVDEIARGVVFLCDPASEYINGSTLSIDGGINLPWWESRNPPTPAAP
jgi:glucose 1-dehydrogenase